MFEQGQASAYSRSRGRVSSSVVVATRSRNEQAFMKRHGSRPE
jgi:hypothetical protein